MVAIEKVEGQRRPIYDIIKGDKVEIGNPFAWYRGEVTFTTDHVD